jgi:hypothetical protein
LAVIAYVNGQYAGLDFIKSETENGQIDGFGFRRDHIICVEQKGNEDRQVEEGAGDIDVLILRCRPPRHQHPSVAFHKSDISTNSEDLRNVFLPSFTLQPRNWPARTRRRRRPQLVKDKASDTESASSVEMSRGRHKNEQGYQPIQLGSSFVWTPQGMTAIPASGASPSFANLGFPGAGISGIVSPHISPHRKKKSNRGKTRKQRTNHEDVMSGEEDEDCTTSSQSSNNASSWGFNNEKETKSSRNQRKNKASQKTDDPINDENSTSVDNNDWDAKPARKDRRKPRNKVKNDKKRERSSSKGSNRSNSSRKSTNSNKNVGWGDTETNNDAWNNDSNDKKNGNEDNGWNNSSNNNNNDSNRNNDTNNANDDPWNSGTNNNDTNWNSNTNNDNTNWNNNTNDDNANWGSDNEPSSDKDKSANDKVQSSDQGNWSSWDANDNDAQHKDRKSAQNPEAAEKDKPVLTSSRDSIISHSSKNPLFQQYWIGSLPKTIVFNNPNDPTRRRHVVPAKKMVVDGYKVMPEYIDDLKRPLGVFRFKCRGRGSF